MAPTKQRATRQGGAVREALRAQGGFRSAQDVYAQLRTDGGSVGLSTVYRHLQSLVDEGVVDVIHTPDGEATYRYCGDTATDHHHHLVCRVCGRTVEIEGRAVERWAGEVAREHGYTDVDHTVELFGLCPQCAAAR
ncbi:Fur family transcriptional regulator [Jatrophihabitans fulvus]